MNRLASSAEPAALSVPIVLSCLMVLAVALLPLLVARHLMHPGRPTRLYRALGSIVLACLALLALSHGR